MADAQDREAVERARRALIAAGFGEAIDPSDLRAALAEPGEQSGRGAHTWQGPCCVECEAHVSWCDSPPAPVVPDSAGLRERLLHVLDSHGIDTYIDGTGAEVRIQNLITDILAVVGQGVTAERAWGEGYAAAEGMARSWGHVDYWEPPAPESPYRTPSTQEPTTTEGDRA